MNTCEFCTGNDCNAGEKIREYVGRRNKTYNPLVGLDDYIASLDTDQMSSTEMYAKITEETRRRGKIAHEDGQNNLKLIGLSAQKPTKASVQVSLLPPKIKYRCWPVGEGYEGEELIAQQKQCSHFSSGGSIFKIPNSQSSE